MSFSIVAEPDSEEPEKQKAPRDPAGLCESHREKCARSTTPSEGGTASRGGNLRIHGAHNIQNRSGRKIPQKPLGTAS
ncbi:MAG: hypothetical protein ACXWLZ_12405 [Rhizomicrobium sp.]